VCAFLEIMGRVLSLDDARNIFSTPRQARFASGFGSHGEAGFIGGVSRLALDVYADA